MVALPFTLRQLEVFERLCETRSFREASEELGISQASVSNQLKTLEEQLGVRLLLREPGKRPQLTADGASFLADLGDFRDAAMMLSSYRDRNAGDAPGATAPLKAMVSLQLLDDYIRPKLGRFLHDHPQIQLEIDPMAAYSGPRDAAAEERFDLGIFCERAVNPATAEMRVIAKERCGVFGHRDLAGGRPLPLEPGEVSGLPFVLPPEGSYHERETLDMLARHGIHPFRIVGRTQYFDVMSAMIGSGTCVGVTLEPLVRPEQRADTVLLYRLEDWQLTLYANAASPNPMVGEMGEFLVSAIVDDPAYPAYAESD